MSDKLLPQTSIDTFILQSHRRTSVSHKNENNERKTPMCPQIIAQDSKKLSITDQTTTTLDDTVHYLSPASPISVRTVHEGDYIYKSPSFMRLLEEFERERVYSISESSSVPCEELEFQRTLAIVKPEAMKYQDVILRKIVDSGFSIIQARTVHLTPEQVSEIYTHYYGSPIFPYMVVSMSLGPVLVLSMASRNAVAKWRNIVGEEKALREEWFYKRSMMVKYGIVASMSNALHASDDLGEATKQNRYFFPKNVLEPIITEEEKVCDYCSLYINPTLLKGLAETIEKKPVDPVLFLAEWLLLNNPFQPRFPPKVATVPT